MDAEIHHCWAYSCSTRFSPELRPGILLLLGAVNRMRDGTVNRHDWPAVILIAKSWPLGAAGEGGGIWGGWDLGGGRNEIGWHGLDKWGWGSGGAMGGRGCVVQLEEEVHVKWFENNFNSSLPDLSLPPIFEI